MTTSTKKRVRRAAKRAMPLETRDDTLTKAVEIGAAGVGAYIAGKSLFAMLRFLVGATIVVATAAAVVSLLPETTQRRLIGSAKTAASGVAGNLIGLSR
ncbi:MAG TPA: hypothetical protein VGG10_09180 [Rhizomicrobium sp.]